MLVSVCPPVAVSFSLDFSVGRIFFFLCVPEFSSALKIMHVFVLLRNAFKTAGSLKSCAALVSPWGCTLCWEGRIRKM